MGTDIHCFVERRAEGRWHLVPPLVETLDRLHVLASRKLRRSYPGRIVETEEERLSLVGAWESRCEFGRNYGLFAILAGVRNGLGLDPIVAPRGLPDDASNETRWSIASLLGHEDDCHDHSWLTLEEILAFDWTREVRRVCLVDGPGYVRFRERPVIEPSRVRFEPRERVVSNEAMDDALRRGDTAGLLTEVTEVGSYRAVAGTHFLEELVPALRELGRPQDVRLVFFFDS
ncbi:MAG: hypothetical protein H6721_15675 [Sandaracinus sp.]|nr:hypothetical protein [Sandaracinus sp.]MCB9616180.1 hypothetical protein [Sandaracinus sp.]MCB9618066.1 hypothetical protein [Sandaracinus sp.]MCB9624084.1 hypothetical protein [Sandaracinus sp.]MCB9633556.1 hypothetical protein [Sandaracinus sp.]